MKQREATPTRRAGEGGSSLVEVLVALLIFLFLMIAVLQMFSMAFVVNQAAAERTEMTYKCQQVVENMRYVNQIYETATPHSLPGTMPADIRAWWPLTDGHTYDLYTGAQFTGTMAALQASYWGPTNTNVVESPNPRYALSIGVVADGLADTNQRWYWRVTVTAQPNPLATASKYIGRPGRQRKVEYVAYIPRQ